MITVYWLVGAAILLVIEMITVSLTSIWFAGGAVAAAIVSVFFQNIAAEIVVFLIVSVVLLVLTRPMAVKYVNTKVEKTNADALVGKHCKVAQTIDPDQASGVIMINGVEWGAKPADGVSVIPAGTEVVIREIAGVKLVVEPLAKETEAVQKEEQDNGGETPKENQEKEEKEKQE